jgi:pimeloyl-ACP methyl ester carboxylesterase
MPETDSMTERQFFAASDGVEIAYYIDDFTDPWKPSQTLFISHPAMSSAWRVYAFVPHLARHFRVVRVDTRGHGASQIPPSHLPLTRERLMQDLLELQSLRSLRGRCIELLEAPFSLTNYSGRTLASLMTFAHLAVSLLR